MNMDVMGVQEVSPGYEFVAENPAVPVGYKQTEVGVIPEDWNVSIVSDLGQIITGGTPRTSIKAYWGDEYPWVTPTDISNRKDIYVTARHITTDGLRTIRPLPPNTVLVTCIASIGKNAVLQVHGGCNQQINAVIPNKNNDPDFLYYLFEFSKPYLIGKAGTTATSIVSKRTFSDLKFALPKKCEQRAIATALSDVDALLEELDRLIAKKRDIKQAAMQQLLTGETRLPGFEGKWDRVCLGDIVDRLSNGAVYKPIGRGGVPITRIETIAHGCIDLERTGNAAWDASLTQYELKTGDILFSHINSVDHIGKVAIIDDVHRPIYHGMNLLLIRVKESYSSKYLFYWLDFEVTRRTMRALAKQAVSQASINTSELRTVDVYLPRRKEQDAIAVALSDIDAEIQALEQRRSKTAELKQGMMQELLTGRTRLV